MNVLEHAALAPHTTFGLGGAARFLVDAQSPQEVAEAVSFARAQTLPLLALGGGSNILVPDGELDAVVVRMSARRIELAEGLIVADAGASWEDVVDYAAARGLWGIENLAGIPGTIGGAAVQNIGAYGAELSAVFAYADAYDVSHAREARVREDEARFGYRASRFKEEPGLFITRVALRVSSGGVPNTAYADLARLAREGRSLSSPREVAAAVRSIRARKFPRPAEGGSAGSFFKNPILPAERAAALSARYPELPVFPQRNGAVKVSLAWLLDHALALKGYARGGARVFERQPLVLVADAHASAADVDTLASEIERRVYDAFEIRIEREVETFGARRA